MKKKAKGLMIVATVLLIAFIYFRFFHLDPKVSVADDEIRMEIQLDVEEDIGLFIIDLEVAGETFSGGISNADKSLLKQDELLVNHYTKEDLNKLEDLDDLKVRFSIITKYVDPNYENIYPEDDTKRMDWMTIDARYGETYRFKVTGSADQGYQVVLENPTS